MQVNAAKTKLIEPKKPEADRILLFWFCVFVLPALICRFASGVYVKSADDSAFLNDSMGLKIEAERFNYDLKAENMLFEAFTAVKKQLEASDWPAAERIEPASLSKHISSLFTSEHSLTPIFCGITNLTNRQTGGFSHPDSSINPGRRSLEIIMSHLFPGPSSRNDEAEKRYQLIAKTVFGSFLEPAARAGVMRSGFFVKGKADRLFFIHDSFTNQNDNTRFAFLLIFSENSIGLKQLLKYARLKPSSPEFTRSYAILPVLPDRDIVKTNDNQVVFATTISPSVLRTGSHAGKSWYDVAMRNGSARAKPAKLPFMVISKPSQITYPLYLRYQPLISLALLAFVFGGLAITRQFLTGNLYPAPLHQRFKTSLLAATLMPFLAFVFTAEQFTDHFSNVIVSSQTQNIVNDLQMLELNILSHDLRERQTTTRFVSELSQQRSKDAAELKKILESQRGKLYEGYALLRSDGVFLEQLPDRTGVSIDDFNKLQMVKEVNFSQLYNIFLFAGALKPEFADNAGKIPEFVKWKAFSGHFNEVDRDSFCNQDGKFFLSRNAEKNYFRISFHNLFPDSDKTELWAGLTLVKNSRSSVEKFLLDQGTSSMVFRQQGGLTVHSAVFRSYEDGSGIDLSFVWPASARKDNELVMAARHLNESLREASWLKYDGYGMITVYAAKAMSDLPFILVSRCHVSLTALNERMFQLAAVLLIPYAMLLFAVLSSLLADAFLKPIKLLLEGVDTLENGSYPTIKYTAENELGTLISHFNTMSEGMRQRKLLQRFISDEVSSSISEEAESMQESSGSLVFRTIMFLHIRDFAALSERIAPEQSINLLSNYFSTMEPCLKKFNGQIDKYIGDAVMVSFSREKCSGAPEIAACQAALCCLATIPGLNHKLANEGLPPVCLGLGIACGQVIRGKIGARQGRQDFTLIGDPVNLAARLESVSHFDNRPHILIDDRTAVAVNNALNIMLHANLVIKGKAEPVRVHELLGNKHEIC